VGVRACVPSLQTPRSESTSDAKDRLPSADKPAVPNARRINREAQNKQRFRAAKNPDPLRPAGSAVRFVCECAKIKCGEFISCSLGDYMHVRSWRSRFLVVAGHEDLNLERVVERHQTWLMVDTLEPVRWTPTSPRREAQTRTAAPFISRSSRSTGRNEAIYGKQPWLFEERA
jgi:hypothetical protein